MAWKGFITESKRYMNYPTIINTETCWCPSAWRFMNAEEKRRAVRFWLFFPRAWFRFFVLIPLGDWRARRRNGDA